MSNVNVNEIPMWLRAGLDEGAPDNVLNKRNEPRHGWTVFTRAKHLGIPTDDLTSVKTFNVSRNGLCLITRQPLHEGDKLVLTPMDQAGEPVHVRVVHCRQTVQGYKVGCEFVAG